MNTNVTQKEAKLGLIAQNWTKYIFKKSTEKKKTSNQRACVFWPQAHIEDTDVGRDRHTVV